MARSNPNAFLKRYFLILASCVLAGLLVLAPWCFWWLYQSGDAGVERAVSRQARGEFVLFGSGLSQDFIDYKLQLYKAIKPEIIVMGSSRVMQFRGAWFTKRFVNMGGVAGNLAVLRSTLDAALAISRPRVVIIGIDFWWFLPQWEQDPLLRVLPTTGSYNYSLASLKKPLEWFLEGKVSFRELGAPVLGIFGKGFRADRFGIMAQQTNDGFGPDGSWYYTAEITGQKPALDYRFQDTLLNVERGIRAFYHAHADQHGPDETHIDAFADIWYHLKSRGIQTYAFIPPLAGPILKAMSPDDYPHLYKLREILAQRGIDVLDYANPRSLGADDCEFVDGFHGGEVVYARILRQMADHWPALLGYVNMERLDRVIRDWAGHTLVPNPDLTERSETDFLGLDCPKRNTIKVKK